MIGYGGSHTLLIGAAVVEVSGMNVSILFETFAIRNINSSRLSSSYGLISLAIRYGVERIKSRSEVWGVD